MSTPWADEAAAEVQWGRLMRASALAMINEAAQPVSQLLVTLALAHVSEWDPSLNTATLAAYAAVASTFQFMEGLFNFLLVVVMARVGHAVGAGRWVEVGHHVRAALVLAFFIGVLCSTTLLVLRDHAFQVLGLEPQVLELALGYYHLRLIACPFSMLSKCGLGVLSGYQRLSFVAAVSVLGSSLEGVGTAVALFYYGLGLNGSGMATLINFAVQAAFSLVGIVLLPPAVAHGQIQIVRRHQHHCPWETKPFGRTLSALIKCCWPRRVALLWSGALTVAPANHRCIANEYSQPKERWGWGWDTQCCGKGDRRPWVAEQRGEGSEQGTSTISTAESDDLTMTPKFSVWGLLADSGNMMIRSICLQLSLYALSICASRTSSASMAAHQVITQLWLLLSYVCDGYADVGTMKGSKMLGARQFGALRCMSDRLQMAGLLTGLVAAGLMVVGKDAIITVFAGDTSAETVQALHQVWPLIAALQPFNAMVFVFDGLLSATRSFAYVRNVFLVGVPFLYLPVLFYTNMKYHTLLAIWGAKACLNLWRFATSVWRVDVTLRRQWRKAEQDELVQPMLVESPHQREPSIEAPETEPYEPS